MSYPDEIDRFIPKLNRSRDYPPYIVQEVIEPVNGIAEVYLAHDDIPPESIEIWTGPDRTGEKVVTYTISTPPETPWQTFLRVIHPTTVYVIYETPGDRVEAEDINRLQDSIVATQKELEKTKLIQVSTYTHNQIVPLSVWTITHNLKKYPSVTVVDSSGSVVVGDVKYLSENELQVSFSGAFAGKAYLN